MQLASISASYTSPMFNKTKLRKHKELIVEERTTLSKPQRIPFFNFLRFVKVELRTTCDSEKTVSYYKLYYLCFSTLFPPVISSANVSCDFQNHCLLFIIRNLSYFTMSH